MNQDVSRRNFAGVHLCLSILRLLQRAADADDQDRYRPLDKAQKLAHELRAVQDRIAQLEGDVAAYRGHAERAELLG